MGFFLNGVYIGSRAATGKTPFQCSQEGSNTYPSTIIISDERLFQNWFIDGANTLGVYDNVQNAAFAGITAKINYTTNAVTYDWSPADGLSAANIANPIASPTSTTTYTVNYKDAAGCAATDDITVTVGANSIATGAVDNTLCINENISVPYTATGTYNTTNTFTAQLSNATGDFTNAINIGSVAATTSGTITATLPANTTSGAGYRIRVVSGDAAVTGSDNGRDITITALATFYSDSDGDGYGNSRSSTQSCSAPAGYVSDHTDCDDNNAAFHPGATEVCNGIDDDCDGQIDEGVKTTYYRDADGDGYSNNSSSTQSCSAPAGYVSDNTDCDDSKATVHPGATEVCNGIDDDCDGQIDEGVKTTYYRDADGDGFGNSRSSTQSCSAPAGYVSDNTDCDDSKATVHPGATEVCNGIDDDCDGQTDEGFDADGDGYTSCNGDCDDNNADVHPGATEVCNGVDDDCDGQIDEGVKSTYYRDADGDGYGNNSNSTQACSAPAGYVSDNTDCDDTKVSVHPNATEVMQRHR
ncbi:MAG: putative metal-binding motif-containing protein [Segetibacter sp.]